MTRSILAITTALVLFSTALHASLDTTLTLHSRAFGGERQVRVFLPERYSTDTAAFAITVVLDAQYDQFWNMAKSNLDYLVDSYQVLPMIAVGIVSEDRGSDFAPPSTALKTHLRKEVLPLIDQLYRTAPYRICVGHSWGGAFVGHTAFSEDRDLFQGYLSISGSLDADDYVILHQADSLLGTGTPVNHAFVATVGDVGRREAESRQALDRMHGVMNKYATSGVAFMPEIFPETDHWSVVIPSFNAGLVKLSREVWFDQWHFEHQLHTGGEISREYVERWTALARNKYGYARLPGPGDLRFCANDFRDMGHYQSALQLYEWGMELAPESARIQYDLCWVKHELGVLTTEDTVLLSRLAETQKDTLSDTLYTHFLEWAAEHTP